MLIYLGSTECPYTGAEWNPTGNPIGGGPGYSDSVRHQNADYYVTNKGELIAALAGANSQDIIYVDDNVEINLTGDELTIPGGVTLASGRGRVLGDTISWGALLYTDDVNDHALELFTTSAGDGIRITGLRIRGPHHYRAGRNVFAFSTLNKSFGIFAWHDELEVDNCEFWGWGNSAIYYSAVSGYAHHNYIHEGQNYGQGLGITIGHYGEAIIEANLFDFIRENIASVGDTNTSWEARYNIGLEHAAEHNFDRHGWPSDGGFGGKKTLIHHNTSRNFGNLLVTTGKSVRIRGMPVQCCSIYNNWLYASDSISAIRLWAGDTNCFIFNNHFGVGPPSGLDSRLPIALAHADIDSGTVPLAVSFIGAGSFDPDGRIAWCEWDFGDNSNTIRKGRASYTFDEIGVYNVRLTVHDDDGIPDSDFLHIIAAPSNDSFYISAWVNDRYHSSDTGFFFKQILINDNVVWEDDIAECEGWVHVVKNVTEYIVDHDSVAITCRLRCRKDYAAGTIDELQTYWDDIALFWGNIQNGDFETGSGKAAMHWYYSESNVWFHGTWTSADVRSGNRAYRMFFYTNHNCNAGQYAEITQTVSVGAMYIPQSDRQNRVFYIYPNPTMKEAAIIYQTSVRSDISVRIYDTNGRLVKTLLDKTQESGFYETHWDGRDNHSRNVANGIYFCKFIAEPIDTGEKYSETKKVVFLR